MVLPSPHLTTTGVQPEGAPRERCQLRGEAAVEDHGPSDNRAFRSHPVQKEPWPHKTGALLETSLVVPW